MSLILKKPTEQDEMATAVSNATTPGEETDSRGAVLPLKDSSCSTSSHVGQTVDSREEKGSTAQDGEVEKRGASSCSTSSHMGQTVDSREEKGATAQDDEVEKRSGGLHSNGSALKSNSNTFEQFLKESFRRMDREWHERDKAMMEKSGWTRKTQTRSRQMENKSESEERSWNRRGRRRMQNSAGGKGRQRLCEHYQRLCWVHFPCCSRIYPCEKCHNHVGCSTAADAESKDADYLKCSVCYHLQEINQDAHTCAECGTKFAAYFCAICKYFTGTEMDPFHCTKCGICRMYKDTSFHCDVCNICLGKRLEGRHRCRQNLGEELCPICQEKIFSEGMTLPCSHFVHEKCVISMKDHGWKKCPICGELALTLD